MKDLKRQDRNGSRTTTDIERKYRLGQIEYTAKEIEELKSKLVVDSSLSASSPNAIANSTVTQALNAKVNKETGKGLSTNDYSNADKEKLEGIPSNAEENVIESISINGVEQEIKDKNVDIKVSGGALSILDAYPVGSIYMSVNSTNPSTLFGGTWEAWGSGRVPVGVDATQTEFNTVEKTGGEKTHTLTIDEMPSHTHKTQGYNKTNYGVADGANSLARWKINTDPEENGPVLETGGNQPHNNLQPYITCYMWKRTA